MGKETKSFFQILVVVLLSSFAVYGMTGLIMSDNTDNPCEGKQWKDPDDRLDCLYPYPPIGRWHAVYTADFAEKYNLPKENISDDFSAGVDYMEIEVLHYGSGGMGCFVNFLIKKPHDIALFNTKGQSVWIDDFNQNRQLLHLIDIQNSEDRIKQISTINSSSRDYKFDERGFSGSTVAMYAENVLTGYDYISAILHCRDVSVHPSYYPHGFSLRVKSANVWGVYNRKPLEIMRDIPYEVKVKSEQNIFVPHELISVIFKDIPIGRGGW